MKLSAANLYNEYISDEIATNIGSATKQGFTELIPWNRIQTNTLQMSSLQKNKVKSDIDCDVSGCKMNAQMNTVFNAKMGSHHIYEYQPFNSSEPARFQVYFKKFDIHYGTDLLYYQPTHKVYVKLANSDNKDEYDECVKHVCISSAIDNVGRKPGCASYDTVEPRYERDTQTLKGLSEKFRCGHWTADNLKLCQTRFVETSATEFLSVYQPNEDFYVEATVCFSLVGQNMTDNCIDFSGKQIDFPITVEFPSKDVEITLNSLYDVPNVFASYQLISYSTHSSVVLNDTETDVKVSNWFSTTGAPTFGAFTSDGLGSVQMKFVPHGKNRSNRVYTSSALRALAVDWAMKDCDTSRKLNNEGEHIYLLPVVVTSSALVFATGSMLRSAVQNPRKIVKVQKGVYARIRRTNRFGCVVVAIVIVVSVLVTGATVGTLAAVADGNSCCLAVAGEKDNHIYELTKSFQPFTNRFSQHSPVLPNTMKFKGGVTNTPVIRTQTTPGSQMTALINVKGIDVKWAKGAGIISSWSFDKIKVFTTSGGSYIDLTVAVTGDFTDVSLISDDFTPATNVVKFSYGTTTKSISIFVHDVQKDTFTLCLNNATNCKAPINKEVDTGPSGGENNAGDNGESGTHGGFNFFFGDWLFSMSWIITAIVITIMFIVAMIMFIKFFKSFSKLLFYYLCCCCLVSTTKAEIVYTETSPGITLVTVLPSEIKTIMATYGLESKPYSCAYTYSNTTSFIGSGIGYKIGALPISDKNPSACIRDGEPISAGLIASASGYGNPTFETVVIYPYKKPYCNSSLSYVTHNDVSEVPADYYDKYVTNHTLVFTMKYADKDRIFLTPMVLAGATKSSYVCSLEGAVDELEDVITVTDLFSFSIDFKNKLFEFYVMMFAYLGNGFDGEDLLHIATDNYPALENIITTPIMSDSKKVNEITSGAAVFPCIGCNKRTTADEYAQLEKQLPKNMLVIRGTGKIIEVIETVDNYDIIASCFYASTFTYCNGTNFDIITSEPRRERNLKIVEISRVNFDMNIVMTTVKFSIVSSCTGRIVLNNYGETVCSHDCCVWTDDQHKTIHYSIGGEKVKKTFDTFRRTLAYHTMSEKVEAPLTTRDETCTDTSFVGRWECMIDIYPEIFWVFMSLFMVSLSIIFIVIIIRVVSVINLKIFKNNTISVNKSKRFRY